MKILISPAKLMNMKHSTEFLSVSTPKFLQEAQYIHSFLREKSPDELRKLMGISQKLADENWQRNQDWSSKPRKQESTFALFAFTGEVYRGLKASLLDQSSIHYLQQHLRILSGLYGLLKPSDQIMLYRLEMGSRFQFETYQNLYEFWQDRLTNELNSELRNEQFILNLASNEYVKVINRKELKVPMIDVDFQEVKNGHPKTIVVYTKHARGLLVRFCAEHKLQSLDEVKAFNSEGYFLDEERTTEKKLVFVR